MKLISELCEYVQPIITEETAGVKRYFIEGPFLQAELKNKNDRIYPLRILEREVERYTRELINENRALGELGHPDSPSINLDRVSHLIISLRQEGTNFIGRAKIMDTPYGKIVKSLIDEKVKLGVSTRGLGTLRNTSQGNVVSDDFYLATAADIVADPSAPSAFVQGIMEGREWVWNNGILTEKQIAQYQKELSAAPAKKVTPRRVAESKVWQKFMKDIKVVSEGVVPMSLTKGQKVRTKIIVYVWNTEIKRTAVPTGTVGTVIRTYRENGLNWAVVDVGQYESAVLRFDQLETV